MIRFACPSCHAQMEGPDRKAGQKIACLKCGQRLQIPGHNKTILANLISPKPTVPQLVQPPCPAVIVSMEDDASLPVAIPVSPRDRHQSGLGIASFVITFLVGGTNIIFAVLIAVAIIGSPSNSTERWLAIAYGMVVMAGLNGYGIPLCLVSIGLSLAGLIARRDRNHFFTWIGLIGGGIVILYGIASYLCLYAIYRSFLMGFYRIPTGQ
jgi:hypothetical protein